MATNLTKSEFVRCGGDIERAVALGFYTSRDRHGTKQEPDVSAVFSLLQSMSIMLPYSRRHRDAVPPFYPVDAEDLRLFSAPDWYLKLPDDRIHQAYPANDILDDLSGLAEVSGDRTIERLAEKVNSWFTTMAQEGYTGEEYVGHLEAVFDSIMAALAEADESVFDITAESVHRLPVTDMREKPFFKAAKARIEGSER